MAHYNEQMRAVQTDGSGTESVNDVIGARDDGVNTDTLAGRLHSSEEHMHSASKCYPTLADAPVVTAEAADWGVGGALVQIIPASTIGNKFDIHYINVESVSAARSYEMILYYGAGDTECGRIRFTKSAGLDPVLDKAIQTPIIPANSRVQARLASGGVVADTVSITLHYHEYT
jgi:hypothetical protein